MPDLMSGQLASEGVALPPGVQPAVADVAVVVDRADVVARVAAAVPPGVVDGVDARIEPERFAVGCLGVLPRHIDEPGQPSNLSPAHVGVHVYRAVLVAVVQPEQLAVVEPVLLPGGRRVSQLTPRLCLHQALPPLPAPPVYFVNPSSTRSYCQRARLSYLGTCNGVMGVHATIAPAPGCSRWWQSRGLGDTSRLPLRTLAADRRAAREQPPLWTATASLLIAATVAPEPDIPPRDRCCVGHTWVSL